jgi:sulfate adenylyltransferase subunit 1
MWHIFTFLAKKSYIIADTQGHVEYTRYMVTGASTSQVSIILIDARKGVIEQTYRHFLSIIYTCERGDRCC